jgi:hypothetical protein
MIEGKGFCGSVTVPGFYAATRVVARGSAEWLAANVLLLTLAVLLLV